MFTKRLTEMPQIPAEIPRYVTRAAFARLAGVSAVAVHKQVKRRLAVACENGLIDREAPEAVAYLENRAVVRSTLRPELLCREMRAFRTALDRWQAARATAMETEVAVLVAAGHVIDRFGAPPEVPVSASEAEPPPT